MPPEFDLVGCNAGLQQPESDWAILGREAFLNGPLKKWGTFLTCLRLLGIWHVGNVPHMFFNGLARISHQGIVTRSVSKGRSTSCPILQFRHESTQGQVEGRR